MIIEAWLVIGWLLAKTLSLEKRKSKNLIGGQCITNMGGKNLQK